MHGLNNGCIFAITERTVNFNTCNMRTYLENLITEKNKSLDSDLIVEGFEEHIGLTYQMLVDFIVDAKLYHNQIKTTLVKIDFNNGDVFHYINHLAVGMLKSLGY